MPKKTKADKPLVPTQMLRLAFLEMMKAEKGAPERISETVEVYKLPSGETFRLRTNNKPALMAKVASGDVNARLPFESEDYVGIAIPVTDDGIIECYLVPSAVAAKAMKDNHRKWLAADNSHARDNQHRLIRFDGNPNDSGHGFAQHWHQYMIGKTSLDVLPHDDTLVSLASANSGLSEKIAACKKEIAEAAHVPVSAVSITISY
jgi:hypothetical protein